MILERLKAFRIMFTNIILISVIFLTMGNVLSNTLAKFETGRKTTSLDSNSNDCSETKDFKLLYEENNGLNLYSNDTWSLGGNSILGRLVCTAGILKLNAVGEKGGGVYPSIKISLNQKIIYQSFIATNKKLSIPVQEPGLLTIAFLNDFYLADVRLAKITLLSGSALECSTELKVSIPDNSGGIWVPAQKIFTVVRGLVTVDLPCQSGTLKMRVEGRSGGGQLPKIQISGNTNDLQDYREIQLGESSENITLLNTNRRVNFQLTNPYAKTLSDRNLYLKDVTYEAH